MACRSWSRTPPAPAAPSASAASRARRRTATRIGIGQWGTNVASGAIYPLNFDLVADFEPVGLISTQPFLIVARKTMPAENLKDLVAWLKANQDKASQGNSGVGTPSHVGGLLFQKAIGASYTMVPYRGAGQSMQDLVAGQLDVMLDTPAVSMPQVRGGNIKAYAVTAPSRIKVAPEIPTTDEAGLPGFYFSFWHAFWVPKGTPKEIVTRLNQALVKALADPDTRERLTKIAQDIFPPEQLTPAGARRLSQGRNRQMVADHQGSRNQAAMIALAPPGIGVAFRVGDGSEIGRQGGGRYSAALAVAGCISQQGGSGLGSRDLDPDEKKVIADAVGRVIKDPRSAKFRWAKFPCRPRNRRRELLRVGRCQECAARPERQSALYRGSRHRERQGEVGRGRRHPWRQRRACRARALQALRAQSRRRRLTRERAPHKYPRQPP